jgi:hypothetical protein
MLLFQYPPRSLAGSWYCEFNLLDSALILQVVMNTLWKLRQGTPPWARIKPIPVYRFGLSTPLHSLHTAPIHSALHSRLLLALYRNPCLFDMELATIILSPNQINRNLVHLKLYPLGNISRCDNKHIWKCVPCASVSYKRFLLKGTQPRLNMSYVVEISGQNGDQLALVAQCITHETCLSLQIAHKFETRWLQYFFHSLVRLICYSIYVYPLQHGIWFD